MAPRAGGQHCMWWSGSGYFWTYSPWDLLFDCIWAMRKKREVKNDSNVFSWSNYVNDGAIF